LAQWLVCLTTNREVAYTIPRTFTLEIVLSVLGLKLSTSITVRTVEKILDSEAANLIKKAYINGLDGM
jgi:hypothetical protein